MNADIKAIDDMYAITPHGIEYTAKPDGTITETAHHERYLDKKRKIKKH
jgi:hypothetical protein